MFPSEKKEHFPSETIRAADGTARSLCHVRTPPEIGTLYEMSVVTICEKLPFLGDVVGKRKKLNNMQYLSQTG